MAKRPVLAAVDESFLAPTSLPAQTCKRPGCNNGFVSSARGRPRAYCSPACGRRHARDRDRIAAEITRLRRLAEEYGIEEPDPPAVHALSQELHQIRAALGSLVEAIDAIEASCQSTGTGQMHEALTKVVEARDRTLARLARQQVLRRQREPDRL